MSDKDEGWGECWTCQRFRFDPDDEDKLFFCKDIDGCVVPLPDIKHIYNGCENYKPVVHNGVLHCIADCRICMNIDSKGCCKETGVDVRQPDRGILLGWCSVFTPPLGWINPFVNTDDVVERRYDDKCDIEEKMKKEFWKVPSCHIFGCESVGPVKWRKNPFDKSQEDWLCERCYVVAMASIFIGCDSIPKGLVNKYYNPDNPEEYLKLTDIVLKVRMEENYWENE